jgi:hypothetical protein
MTKFEELQLIHQRLLDHMDEVADKAAFMREVQDYVTRVRDEAVDVPTPRDRDQLRANLRYWASYLYDATGTYPNTTLRPARPVAVMSPESIAFTPPSAPSPASAAPPAPTPAPTASPVSASAPAPIAPSRAATPGWRAWLVAAIILLLLGVMYLWVRANPQGGAASSPPPETAIVQPNPAAPNPTLTLSWRAVTAGPSPFNPNIWVARIELGATGGNNEYIFWVNGQRLPEASNNQFTVESQGCQPVSQYIGVTSGGQSARQELVIQPPEPNSCPK